MAARLTDKLVRTLEPPPRPRPGQRPHNLDPTYRLWRANHLSGRGELLLNYRRKANGLERRYTVGAFRVGPSEPHATRLNASSRHRRRGDRSAGSRTSGERRRSPNCAHASSGTSPKLRPPRHGLRDVLEAQVCLFSADEGRRCEYADIERLHTSLSERAPYLANRELGSKQMSRSEPYGGCTNDPVRGVQRNQEPKRKGYLSNDELARLTKMLAKYPNREASDALRLILLTGVRKTKVLSATSDQFDPPTGAWTKPVQRPSKDRAPRFFERPGVATACPDSRAQ